MVNPTSTAAAVLAAGPTAHRTAGKAADSDKSEIMPTLGSPSS